MFRTAQKGAAKEVGVAEAGWLWVLPTSDGSKQHILVLKEKAYIISFSNRATKLLIIGESQICLDKAKLTMVERKG